MTNTRKFFMLLSMAATMLLWSCGEDDSTEDDGPMPPDDEVITGVISESTTWTADRIYELSGRVIVPEGVTLTIEAGTIVKGQEGNGTNASVLIVSRGGQLNAQGTAEAPIVFTSVLDNLDYETSSQLTKTDNELWGGVIVLGSAPISAENGDTEASIEGLPADEDYGLYGGDNANDNSGTITYISIRHGGIAIGDGNEINGLTLGGVGAGTTIENVEVYATLDDGIEFFGGTVDVDNALVFYQDDDGIDLDQNWSGTLDNFIVVHAGEGTDEGLEIDGPEGSTYVDGLFTLTNGTIISEGGGTPADLKSDAQGTLDNLIFEGYAAGDDLLKVRAKYDDNCAIVASSDAYGNLTDDSSTTPLIVVDSKVAGTKVYDKNKDAPCDVSDDDQAAADAKVTSNDNATGATASAFSWTHAAMNGELN